MKKDRRILLGSLQGVGHSNEGGWGIQMKWVGHSNENRTDEHQVLAFLIYKNKSPKTPGVLDTYSKSKTVWRKKQMVLELER